MGDAQPTADGMADVHFRAQALARRTVEYHHGCEAEHRSRERFGRRFTPYPWSEAAAAVLSDEALEDEQTVVALIRELGRQGCSEVALAALDLVVNRGSPAPSKDMFNAAILVCATEYQDERCVEQYDRMRSLDLLPDLATLNLVLTGLCCRGRLARAMELLGEMRSQLGLRPNSYSVLMVLQACNYKRRGAYREAIDAVQALEAGGRTANEEVIEALLQVCEAAMHQAPSFEAAVAVFTALSELHLADSTRVYNGLLGAAGRAGRWREAQALYAQMQEDDVPASLETHTALIQACVVGRALDHALDIFEHLVAGRSAHEAVPASIATYNHLIHACHQAGMLEKALEIASWVQKTGVEFDDETYGELMATIDVAQLWDDKAMKQARQRHNAVLPRHLRPAPYDAMRVMYLDHLDSLQQEELLALEKLGGLGSWAPKSLTRGPGAPGSGYRGSPTPPLASSVSSSSRSLARAVGTVPSATLVGGYDAEPCYGAPGGQLTTSAAAAAAMRAAASSPVGPPGVGGAAERGGAASRSPSPSGVQTRAASVKQLLKSLSTRPLPALGGGTAGSSGMSFRASGGAGSGTPPPPTGFHEPPTWAQLQTMDAATAGPGGTPFSAVPVAAPGPGADDGSGGGGPDHSSPPMPLSLAVEPANLFGQSSVASLGGVGTGRASMRSIAAAGGGSASGSVSGGMRGAALSPGNGALPPLAEPLSPRMAAAQGALLGSPNSPRTGGGASAGSGVPLILPASRQRARITPRGAGGPGATAAAELAGAVSSADFLPSPLPTLSNGLGMSASRRYSLAPLATGTGKPAAAAGAGA